MDDLDLSRWSEAIVPTDDGARAAALARQEQLTKPSGALGRLEDVSVWLAGVTGQCPPPPIRNPALAIFAGDHGVARTAGTSAYPPEVTAQMVANFVTGGAAATVLARAQGVTVRIVDVSVDIDWPTSGLPVPADVTADRIRRGSGSIDREDAMTREECVAALLLGARVADELVDGGADLLIAGDMGIGNTTPAAALVGLLADVEPARVVGRGTGIDDATWMRKTAAVRDAMRRGRPVKGDPVALLATCGGPDLAATTGFLLQAAAPAHAGDPRRGHLVRMRTGRPPGGVPGQPVVVRVAPQHRTRRGRSPRPPRPRTPAGPADAPRRGIGGAGRACRW